MEHNKVGLEKGSPPPHQAALISRNHAEANQPQNSAPSVRLLWVAWGILASLVL